MMGKLRPLILALGVLVLGVSPGVAQRDPEKTPPQILQPGPVTPPGAEKPERPAPALQATVAVLCAALVLYIVCKPSRKGIPS
jgi:hypothetical protein